MGTSPISLAVSQALLPNLRIDSHRAVIDSERQKDLLERSLRALEHVLQGLQAETPLDLVAVDLKDALDALSEITGEVTSADILNVMFSRFCVGK